MSSGRVVLIGAVHECLAAFRALLESPDCELVGVVTLNPEESARVSGAVDLASLARLHGVPALLVRDVNSPSSVDAIEAMAPDLIAVVGWTRLIREALLDLPTHGCVGFHASLLPHNRGRAPVNWAILNGEKRTGNTMMQLNAGVDTGGIIDQRSTPIGPNDTCATVYRRIAVLGGEMLRDNVGPVLRGEVAPRPQDESQATLLPKRVPAMGVIDWRRSSEQVHNWVRAQTAPYPGAFTHLRGKRLYVWSSLLPATSSTGSDQPPGTVMRIGDNGIEVSTGLGTVLLTHISDSTNDRQSLAALAKDIGLRAGVRFDQPSDAWVDWSLGLGPRPEEAS